MEIRLNCENCDKSLANISDEAMICTLFTYYESLGLLITIC
jgi:hypothetical protein